MNVNRCRIWLVILFFCVSAGQAPADTLFWWASSNIYRQDTAGGPATLIRSGPHSRSQRGSGLEVVGERLYMFEGSGLVSSMDFDGQNYTPHHDYSRSQFYTGFATDGTYAYALNTDTMMTDRLDLSNGLVIPLSPFTIGGPGGGIDIDSANGKVYWGRETRTFAPTFTVPGFIGRSTLDGANFESHDRNIRALSVDIPNERIYWASGAWDELWSGDLSLAPGNDFISNATLLATTDRTKEGTGSASEMVYHAGSNRLFYSAWNQPYIYTLDLADNSISKFQFTGDMGTYVNGGIAIAVTPIPEPSTLVLLAIGTVGLLLRCAGGGKGRTHDGPVDP
ncbi:MAG: PEP-CTERM sorting domain-containing protein [Pirellulales bacterium]